MKDLQCETCRWFKENKGLHGEGWCHRHPPSVEFDYWPTVSYTDFCGEHSESQSPTAPALEPVEDPAAQLPNPESGA